MFLLNCKNIILATPKVWGVPPIPFYRFTLTQLQKKGNRMNKGIKFENNCIKYNCTDKNGEIQTAKIANYFLKGLFTLKMITDTKNSYKITEKLVL